MIQYPTIKLIVLFVFLVCQATGFASDPDTPERESEAVEIPDAFGNQLSEVIPAENLPDVRHGVQHGLINNGRQPLRISPLHGGMSARVFSITGKKNSWVLRIIPRRKDQLEFHREIFFAKVMSQNRTGPTLFYAGEEDGIIIMQQLANKPPTSKNSPEYSQAFLSELGHLLIRLHSTPYTGNSDLDISMLERTRQIRERIPYSLPIQSERIFSAIKKANAALEPHKNPRLVHHDLNPNNVLDDGSRLWLIDWELTGMGDPWYDLATASIFFTSNPEQEHTLLVSYLGRNPNQIEKAMLYVNKCLCLSFYGHVLQIVAGDQAFEKFDTLLNTLPKLKDLFKQGERWANFKNGAASVSKFGMVLLKEALLLMDSNDWNQSLKLLKNSVPISDTQN